MENWKDIKGYEGYYMISNLGRIKSVERQVAVTGGKNKSGYKIVRERIIKQSLSSLKKASGGLRGRNQSDRRYFRVSLSINGKSVKFFTHRLVYESFVGSIPIGYVIDHIDNNSINNKVDNLQILSIRDNTIKEIDKDKTTSRYIGVHLNKMYGKWHATYNRKRLYYGDSEADAKVAYDNYIKSLN